MTVPRHRSSVARNRSEGAPVHGRADGSPVRHLRSVARTRPRVARSSSAPIDVASLARSKPGLCSTTGSRNVIALHRLDGPVGDPRLRRAPRSFLRRARLNVARSATRSAAVTGSSSSSRAAPVAPGEPPSWRRLPPEGEPHVRGELGQLVLHGEQSVGGDGRDDDEPTARRPTSVSLIVAIGVSGPR